MRCILLKCTALKNSCIYKPKSPRHRRLHPPVSFRTCLPSVPQICCSASLPHPPQTLPWPQILQGEAWRAGATTRALLLPLSLEAQNVQGGSLLAALGLPDSGKGGSFSTIFSTAPTSGLFLKGPVKATGMCWGGDGHLLGCLRWALQSLQFSTSELSARLLS